MKSTISGWPENACKSAVWLKSWNSFHQIRCSEEVKERTQMVAAYQRELAGHLLEGTAENCEIPPEWPDPSWHSDSGPMSAFQKIRYREVSLKPMDFSSFGNNRERRRCTCKCVYVHIWRERAAYVCRSGSIWSEVTEVDEPRIVLTILGQWAWLRRCQGRRTARIQQTVHSFKVFPQEIAHFWVKMSEG